MSSIMPKQIDHVNQSDASSALDVFEALHGLMHLARARQSKGMDGALLGLSPSEGKTLGFFARQPGATQSDLAAHTGRDKGQLARLIGGLKERGLLVAQTDEHDRRVTRLRLTPAAIKLHQAVHHQRAQLAEETVAVLSAAERETLLQLLERLRAAMEAPAPPAV
jgi:DNA-binding MarR family transcriptional regulator